MNDEANEEYQRIDIEPESQRLATANRVEYLFDVYRRRQWTLGFATNLKDALNSISFSPGSRLPAICLFLRPEYEGMFNGYAVHMGFDYGIIGTDPLNLSKETYEYICELITSLRKMGWS